MGESRTLREEEDMEHTKMGQQTKNKSMVLQKQEDELKNRVLRLARKNYHGLGTFIRLIDYMVVETQVKINQESADLILSEMKNQNKKYGIYTVVSYDTKENGMSFNPAKTEFLTQFDKILIDMQSVTAEVLRIINHQNFVQFIQGLISDSGPRFKSIVENSIYYQITKETIQKRIIQDFDDMQTFVSKFELCREVNDFDTTFDFDEFKAAVSDTETIKKQLDKLQKWDADISKYIKHQYSLGLLQLQGKKLKDKLTNRVKQEQKHLKQYLLELADQKAKDIQNGLAYIKNTLQKP